MDLSPTFNGSRIQPGSFLMESGGIFTHFYGDYAVLFGGMVSPDNPYLSSDLWYYSYESREWIFVTGPKMKYSNGMEYPQGRKHFGYAVDSYNRDLYIVGGENEQPMYFTDIWRFSGEDERWFSLYKGNVLKEVNNEESFSNPVVWLTYPSLSDDENAILTILTNNSKMFEYSTSEEKITSVNAFESKFRCKVDGTINLELAGYFENPGPFDCVSFVGNDGVKYLLSTEAYKSYPSLEQKDVDTSFYSVYNNKRLDPDNQIFWSGSGGDGDHNSEWWVQNEKNERRDFERSGESFSVIRNTATKHMDYRYYSTVITWSAKEFHPYLGQYEDVKDTKDKVCLQMQVDTSPLTAFFMAPKKITDYNGFLVQRCFNGTILFSGMNNFYGIAHRIENKYRRGSVYSYDIVFLGGKSENYNGVSTVTSTVVHMSYEEDKPSLFSLWCYHVFLGSYVPNVLSVWYFMIFSVVAAVVVLITLTFLCLSISQITYGLASVLFLIAFVAISIACPLFFMISFIVAILAFYAATIVAPVVSILLILGPCIIAFSPCLIFLILVVPLGILRLFQTCVQQLILILFVDFVGGGLDLLLSGKAQEKFEKSMDDADGSLAKIILVEAGKKVCVKSAETVSSELTTPLICPKYSIFPACCDLSKSFLSVMVSTTAFVVVTILLIIDASLGGDSGIFTPSHEGGLSPAAIVVNFFLWIGITLEIVGLCTTGCCSCVVSLEDFVCKEDHVIGGYMTLNTACEDLLFLIIDELILALVLLGASPQVAAMLPFFFKIIVFFCTIDNGIFRTFSIGCLDDTCCCWFDVLQILRLPCFCCEWLVQCIQECFCCALCGIAFDTVTTVLILSLDITTWALVISFASKGVQKYEAGSFEEVSFSQLEAMRQAIFWILLSLVF